MIIDKSGKVTSKDDLHEIEDDKIKKAPASSQDCNLFADDLNEFYTNINEQHRLEKDKIIPSQKKGIGPVISFSKKMFNKILYPPLSYFFEVQDAFNRNVVNLLNILRERLNAVLGSLNKEAKEHYVQHAVRIEELEKKVLELNHYRYMEIKNLEHLFHKELMELKSELANIVYTYLFLQKNMHESIQGIKRIDGNVSNAMKLLDMLQNVVNEHERAIKIISEELVGYSQELRGMKSGKVQMLEGKIREAFNSLSTLRKILVKAHFQAEETARIDTEKIAQQSVKGEPLDFLYFDLEDSMRGTEEEILIRQQAYLEYLKERQPVIDIGCGRGEMLELLMREEIEAEGIDTNYLMVDYCQSKSLKVTNADALSYLQAKQEGSVGAIIALHVVEHMEAEILARFLYYSRKALKEKGIIILETPNPLGMYTLSRSFYLDFSHVRPVHPEALQRLLKSIGFTITKELYSSPWEEEIKLESMNLETGTGGDNALFRGIKNNFDKLNEILFAPRDYSIIAQK